MPRDRVRTGITGLDAILLGGLPEGNITILTGGPGTGKTTLGLEFIYRGAHDFGEPGLIVTFEVSPERIVADAMTLGWDLAELERQGRIRILSTTRSVFRQEIQQADSLLLGEAGAIGARRLFVDGLAGFAVNGNGGGQPREVFQLLIEGLHRENLTALFALDAPADRAGLGDSSEEFLADTIIRLRQERLDRNTVRSLEVVKSRGHDYLAGRHSFRIVNGHGLEVYRRVQMPRSIAREHAAPTDLTARVPTGIEGLDPLLNGGLFRSSTTVMVGISGTGKSLMGLQYLAEGVRRGERGLMLTLDEPVAQVQRNARSIGIDLQPSMDRDVLRLWYEPPQEIELDRHFHQLEQVVETFQPQRVVIDSLSSYAASMAVDKSFRDFFHALTSLMRERAVTAIYNFENPELLGLSSMMGEVRASSLVDNIILMNWVELGDTFRHALTIAKVRGMPTNRVTHECEILDGRGMVVLPRAVRLAVPSVPFASYYGLLSRAPERHRGGETPPGAQ
jgi:circadian clock protein KaiC